ncbi:MAG: EAL domain-containing protein [Gammaproteobacteria bacterium]|nr:EAL domain-containing protein [Gammaproteobacteria bacterium]
MLFWLNGFKADGSRIISVIPIASAVLFLASDYPESPSLRPTLQVHLINGGAIILSLVATLAVVRRIVKLVGLPNYLLDVAIVWFAMTAATYVIGRSMNPDWLGDPSDAPDFMLASATLVLCWLIVSLSMLTLFAGQKLPKQTIGIVICPLTLSGIGISNWLGIGLDINYANGYFLVPLSFGLASVLGTCHYAYACDQDWISQCGCTGNQSQLGFLTGIPVILAIPVTILVCLLLDLSINVGIAELVITAIGCSWLTFRYTYLIYNLVRQSKEHEQQSQCDDVTQLLNRRGWDALEASSFKPGNGVISININRFKSINDLFGHQFGDRVLQCVAQILRQQAVIGPLARISADEFIGITKPSFDQATANQLLTALQGWHSVEGQQFYLSVSIGVRLQTNESFEQSQSQAQTAMTMAKAQNRGLVVATGNMDQIDQRRVLLATINDSIFRRDIAPIAQPIVELKSYRVIGVEFLMRLNDGMGGTYQPADFLRLTRENGQLRELTLLLAKHIVRHQALYQGLDIHINVPPDFFVDTVFMDKLLSAEHLGILPHQHVVLEITEDTDAEIQSLAAAVKRIRSRGFKVAIDDFGTAYSSLSRLAAIEVDHVKLDRSLLQASSHGGHIMIESSLLIIKRLGVSATIEGIETQAHYDLAMSLEFSKGQGFFLEENLSPDADELSEYDSPNLPYGRA